MNLQQYTLYVPTMTNDGTPVSDAAIDAYVCDLVRVAGGATLSGVQTGYWVDNETLYREPVRTISAIAPDAIERDVRALAHKVACELHQLSVLYTIAPVATHFVSVQSDDTNVAA